MSSDSCIFEMRLEDVSTMNRVLHELHHTDDQSVLVVDGEGLRLITNGEKSFQISAFFAASTFHRFIFDSEKYENIKFRFILKEFIECLNLLRDDPIEEKDKILNMDDLSRTGDINKTSLNISYKKKGNPLRLRLENNSNHVIDCELQAFNLPGDSVCSPIAFSLDEETAMIVFDSKKLYDYVSGIDLVTSEYVKLVLQQGKTPFKLITKSTQLGEVELEMSEDEKEVIVQPLRVSSGCTFSHSYRTQYMKPALDALKTSTFMKLKCGTSSLLCIEHFHGVRDVNKQGGPYMIPNDLGSHGFLLPNQASLEYLTDVNQPSRKRSSVEYLILAEVDPSE